MNPIGAAKEITEDVSITDPNSLVKLIFMGCIVIVMALTGSNIYMFKQYQKCHQEQALRSEAHTEVMVQLTNSITEMRAEMKNLQTAIHNK